MSICTHKFYDISTLKKTLDYVKRLPDCYNQNICINSLTSGFKGLLHGCNLAICFVPKNLII